MEIAFGNTSIWWEGAHTGAGEQSDCEGVADDKVSWTDHNLHSPFPCTAQKEEGEEVVFSLLLVC